MSKARPNPQAESLGYWVFRLHRALHAAFGDRLAALGVTPSEWTALSQAGGGAVTPVALAARMGIDRAAVTRIVDQLERKKLVRRTPHPTDGRSTVLVLTAGGRSLLPKLVQASRETNRSFLGALPPEDAAALLALLRRLGESLPQQVFPFEADET
jgi:DNA-binding MarR family transcriptional regulator